MNGDFEADSVSSYALMTPAGWTSTGDVVVVSSWDTHSVWGGGSSPAGGNYVVLRMDGASISQQCFLTAGSTVSFYLRYRPVLTGTTGSPITLTLAYGTAVFMTVSVPSSTDTTWTPYSVRVPGRVPSSSRPQILRFSIAVADGSDAALEIDNVVFHPPSLSPAVLSLAHRYSFSDPSMLDSVASPCPLTLTLGSSASISSGQLQLPGGSSDLTEQVGSYLQLTASNVLGSPAPAAVSIEMWVTIASSQSNTGNPVIFQLGSSTLSSIDNEVSLNLTWDSVNQKLRFDYLSGENPTNTTSNISSTRATNIGGPISLHIALVLFNAEPSSPPLSVLYVNGDIFGSYEMHSTVKFPLGSPGEVNLIGMGTDPSQPALIGSVDEFRIWHGPLSRREVTALYVMGPDLILGNL